MKNIEQFKMIFYDVKTFFVTNSELKQYFDYYTFLLRMIYNYYYYYVIKTLLPNLFIFQVVGLRLFQVKDVKDVTELLNQYLGRSVYLNICLFILHSFIQQIINHLFILPICDG